MARPGERHQLWFEQSRGCVSLLRSCVAEKVGSGQFLAALSRLIPFRKRWNPIYSGPWLPSRPSGSTKPPKTRVAEPRATAAYLLVRRQIDARGNAAPV